MTPPQSKTPRTLCVWLPDWPIQRIRRQRPELLREAFALATGDGRTERIAACSEAARRLGVQIGQRTPDAQSLAGPGRLKIEPHRPAEDRRALERLAAECERFGPVTSLEDAAEPSALLLDVTGLATLWAERADSGEGRLAQAVSAWIRSGRLIGRVSIAATVGLALAVVRSTADTEPVLVRPQDTLEVARSLPIEAVRCDAATHETLRQLGIDTVGQLMRLPRSALPARFGPTLSRRLDQLLGDSVEPVVSFQEEPPLIATHEFETAVTYDRAIEHAVGEVLKRLSAAMRSRRVGALRLLLMYLLDSPGREPLSESVALRMARPTASASELMELAALRSEGLKLPYAVRAIRGVVGSSAPIEIRQELLFDNSSAASRHELALLVNRLAGRIGAESVCRVEKRRSVDPAKAFAYVPAIDHLAVAFPLSAREANRARRLPLTMSRDGGRRAFVETNERGEPISIRLDGERAVVRCWGPERIETGWWRSRGVQRDAYWVELDTGARLWLGLDLRSREWRLAGEFA